MRVWLALTPEGDKGKTFMSHNPHAFRSSPCLSLAYPLPSSWDSRDILHVPLAAN